MKPERTAADATGEAPAAERTAPWRRPVRPVAFVLQAGSVAAAITSIIGLLVIFVPGLSLGGHAGEGGAAYQATVELPKGQGIKLGIADRGRVERMTYGKWLRVETGSEKGVSEAERRKPGVDVHYNVKFPEFAFGSPFRARFTLKDEAGVTRHVHVTKVRLDADRDQCNCPEFVPVPVGPKSYRVLVEVYRPDAPRWAAPAIAAYTEFFSASGPVSD